ncbi:MAG: hypothetical protein H7Y18_06155 [Clostridiaceae bacterium]|nr:hypothetical protein [Clostridiaceae bacterium]
MKRVKPKKVKPEQKQIHVEMDYDLYLKFEKKIYAMGSDISKFFREKAIEVINK